NVFNAKDTAPLAIEAILKTNGYDPGPKGERIENPSDWTPEKIVARGKNLESNKGPAGKFDD
ncbi:MAG: ketose-bisphosphate aldolase, partial [Desulfatitalea sp.]|nr:ketose-bisphosphate aldolase [Desulfatitalea sp.]